MAPCVGPEALAVSVELWLAGLLCAVLTFSASELAAVEGSKVTEVASALGGLCVGEEWVREDRWKTVKKKGNKFEM